MSDNKIRRRRKKNNFLASFIIIFIAIGFSAAAAAVWQAASPKPEQQKPLELAPEIVNSFAEEDIAVLVAKPKAEVKAKPEEKQDDEERASSKAEKPEKEEKPESKAEQPQSSESEPAAAEEKSLAVPKGERVTSAYFDDAAFIGDSISTGIKLYDVMQNTDVYAAVGISLESIFTNKAIKTEDGSKVTIFDAIDGKEYGKVYIMLGANSLMNSHDALIKQYGKVIDEVKTRLGDDCIIYIQSVFPVYEEVFHKKYPHNTTTNADIDSFNLLLAELASEKGAYYLDIASAIKNADGVLPPESTSDGLHIGAELYIKWFDYLKTHTVSK